MKKNSFILISMFLFVSLFAEAGVQQIIYDTNIKPQNNESSSSVIGLGYNMYRIHMFLGHGGPQVSLSSGYVQLISTLKDAASDNVLDTLEYEIDKKKVMEAYVSRLDMLLLQSDFALSNLKEEMSLLIYDRDFCSSQKKSADMQYLDAVQFPYQQLVLQESITNSKKYGKCVSDNQIEYSAKKILVDKISVYNSVLKIKYDYLFAHKDEIADNYSLIKSDLLQRLLAIKNMLEKYDL